VEFFKIGMKNGLFFLFKCKKALHIQMKQSHCQTAHHAFQKNVSNLHDTEESPSTKYVVIVSTCTVTP
jgi:hypothetical protein